MKSIQIIKDEHRSIAAVIESLRHVLAAVADKRMAPDFELLLAIFGYIEAFPERLHHPKEDEFLFARLRLRRPDAVPLLDRLHTEHEQGRANFAELKSAFETYCVDGSTLQSFRDCVERYAQFQWRHMRQEEDEVLPLAVAALHAEDWSAIDAAFGSNDDPIVGVPATDDFRALFRRIVTLAPPPLGADVAARKGA